MKIAIKLALASAALVSSATFANTLLSTTTSTGGQTGSDLILFISDTTSGSFFAYDTGVSLDSVSTIGGVASAVTGNGGTAFADLGGPSPAKGGTGSSSIIFGSWNNNTYVNPFATFNSGAGATAAASFLASVTAGDTVVWALNAGDGKTNSTNTIGGNRLIVSAQSQPSWTGTITNTSAKGGVSALNNLISAWNVANPANATSSSIGWGFGNSSANSAPYGFYGTNTVSGAAPCAATQAFTSQGAQNCAASTQQYLYLVSNNVAGGSAVAGVQATEGTFTLLSNGQVAYVPVPGAAWLLGSGLLGLVGISRRRRV